MQKKSVGITIAILSLIGIGLIVVSALNKPNREADYRRINSMPIYVGLEFDPVLAQKKAAEINEYAKAFPDDTNSALLIKGTFGNINATLDQTLTLKGQLEPAFQLISQKHIYEYELSMAIISSRNKSITPISISEKNIPILISTYKESLLGYDNDFLLANQLMSQISSKRYNSKIEDAFIQVTKEVAKSNEQQRAINLVVDLRNQLGQVFNVKGKEWPSEKPFQGTPDDRQSILIYFVQSEKSKSHLERILQHLQNNPLKTVNISVVTDVVPASIETNFTDLKNQGVTILTTQSSPILKQLDPNGMDACLIVLDQQGKLSSFTRIESFNAMLGQASKKASATPQGQ